MRKLTELSRWQKLLNALRPSSRERRKIPSAIARRSLRMESLEERQLLAVLYWDPDLNSGNNNYGTGAGLGGAGTTSWTTTNAWADANGHGIPGIVAAAVIKPCSEALPAL